MRKFWRGFAELILMMISLGFLGLLGVFALFGWLLKNYTNDLPDFAKLQDYQPPVVTRVFANNGQLMAEFAEEKRVFVPITAASAIYVALNLWLKTGYGEEVFKLVKARIGRR